MAGEISDSFDSLLVLQEMICRRLELCICSRCLDKIFNLQVVVKKSGDVSQVWRKKDAESMWSKGEVLCASQF